MRVGSQTPRVRNTPPYVKTYGDEAADLMAHVGKPLLPWQREYARDSMGVRADGKWSSYEHGIFVARQNGKGVCIEARQLHSLFILQIRRIIHSAHLFDTSREAFERLMEIIDGSDWLSRRVKQVNRAHGKEGIELMPKYGGGKLKYKARTVHGARGFSAEQVDLDEAYALTTGHMAAISPIMATLPNPVIGYYSSPPDTKTGPMPEDSYLPSLRKRGLAGDPRLTYWEFSPEDGADFEAIETAYGVNPSAGYLIQEEYLRDQLRIFVAAGKLHNYATEHLGVWPADGSAQWQVITEAQWKDALDLESVPQDPVVFAMWTAPDRGQTAIGVVGARSDGDLHGEVVDHRPGAAWGVDRMVELVRRWRPAALVIDAGGATGSAVADLTRELVAPDGVVTRERPLLEITLLTTRQVAQGYGNFRNAIAPGSVPAPAGDERWGGEEPPAPRLLKVRDREPNALTTAVAGATTRSVGDGTTWDSRDATVDISPLRALTDALQGYLGMPAVPIIPPPVTAPMAASTGNFFRPTQRLSL